MSNYININNLAAAFNESDFPKDQNGNDDIKRINEAIDYAEMLADSFIRSAGYPTPIDYDAGIREITCSVTDIAFYRLQDRPSTNVKQRYDDAVAWLEKIAKGIVKLSPAPVVEDQRFEDQLVQKSFGLSSIRVVRE